MTEESERMIRFHEDHEPHESDVSARENAAARIWAIGDEESITVAEAIWKELGTDQSTIEILKEFMIRSKKGN